MLGASTHTFRMSLAAVVVLANLGCGALAQDTGCSFEWSATQFLLPSPFTTWQGTEGNMNQGLQFVDINGDGLVDVLKGFTPPLVICIWLNTGCGWVPQSNYTGPVSTCQPSTTFVLGGTEFDFEGMTVAQLTGDVARELAVSEAAIRVTTSGRRQSGSVRVEKLAARPEGFIVDLEASGVTERVHFTRHG